MTDNVDTSSTPVESSTTQDATLQGTSVSTQGTNGATTTMSLDVTNASWIDKLPDDLKNEPSLQNFKNKDIPDLVKSYISAQKEIGSRVRIPTDQASPEVKKEFLEKVTKIPGIVRLPDPQDPKSVDDFFTKLGRPANPESYKLELPEAIPTDDPTLNQFKQAAFQLGLNNQQTQALVNFELQKQMAVVEAMKAEAGKTSSILKETWGNEFDTRLNLAKEAVNSFSAKYPEAHNSLINSPLANNPIFLQMAAELGRAYRESGVIKGESITKGGYTPEEARNRINDIRANPNHPANPLFKGKISQRERDAALQELSGLYKAANPDNNL